MTALQIAIVCLAIGIPAVLYALYRSPPVPPMRTADARKIERETAEIQGDDDEDGSDWVRIAMAAGFVFACALVAAVVVPK